MRTTRIVAAIAAIAALFAIPAIAAGDPPASNTHAKSHATPGPGASAGAKARAYGKFCQGQSKKHVKGQKGTPYSQCIVAAAKLKDQQAGEDESGDDDSTAGTEAPETGDDSSTTEPTTPTA